MQRAGDTREILRFAAEAATDHLEGLASRPVAADRSDAQAETLRARLGGPLPATGEDPLAVLGTLADCAPAGVVASAGPRYFGYVTGGALPVAVGADWLVTAWDQVGAAYDAGPAVAVAEQAAVDWMVDLLGFGGPGRAVSGGFTTGTTLGHVTALAAARRQLLGRRGWDVEALGLWGAPPLAVLVGETVHMSVLAALRLLGFGRTQIVRVAVDRHGRMRPDALAVALSDCRSPAIVCAQAGEINTGAFDPLVELGALARRGEHWLHVDGAFGLWAAAAPSLAHLTAGLELADSCATDFHKIGNTPYDCGLVLCAHPEDHRAAMGTRAPYTTVGATPADPARRDGIDFTPETSRRARGVPAWAMLRSLGREGVAELVTRCHANAVRLAARLAEEPAVRIRNEVVFNQVLVDCASARMTAPGATRLVGAVMAALHADGTCLLGGTRWQGRPMLRASVCNWSTTSEDVDRSAEAILAAIASVVRVVQPGPSGSPGRCRAMRR